MKRILLLLLAASVIAGCKSNPSVRVVNQLHTKANVTLSPSAGSTLTLNAVDSLSTTSYVDVPEGSCRVHVALSGTTNPEDVSFTAVSDAKYTVQVLAGPLLTVRQD